MSPDSNLRAVPEFPARRATPRLLARACRAAAACLIGALTCGLAGGQSPQDSDWGYYGGDAAGRRWSEHEQIHRGNVARLQVAWTYRTGELGEGFATASKLAFAVTPVHAFDSLFLATPTGIVIALEAATGSERWRFDPRVDRGRRYGAATSRGVTAWEDPAPPAPAAAPCVRRIFSGTLDGRLFALDADTGEPCEQFGERGAVDLTRGVRPRDAGEFGITSPPAVYGDTVLVGSAIGDNRAVEVERGTVHALDARTGAIRWSFDPIPDGPEHPAAAEWHPDDAAATGGGNAWTAFSVDLERGLVFVPTGSASPDFFGGRRRGDNRFANSLLAFEAGTGRLAWHRQLVRHDLWDYDLAAQPALLDVTLDGRSVPAVVQATKTGKLFVFHRETGEPLFPVDERAVPQSRVPGERAAPTQPFPRTPALVTHRALAPGDAWGLTFHDRGKCREALARHRNEGLYTPPDTAGTIVYPGYAGGVNWGSLAVDVPRQRVFAAVNHLPMRVTLLEPAEAAAQAHSGRFPASEFARQAGTPFAIRREPLLSPWGLPCTAPPWGTLASVDLRTNRIAWQVPLGSTAGVGPRWLPALDLGMPNAGGPIVTAGELVFVAAATDGFLRAFDAQTGRELWKHRLPAGGQATPMTYRAGADQRQFVVIAAGGHDGLGTPRGDSVVAFALPRTRATSR
jgi:quinoprotein glucose dehydrogenase